MPNHFIFLALLYLFVLYLQYKSLSKPSTVSIKPRAKQIISQVDQEIRNERESLSLSKPLSIYKRAHQILEEVDD